MDLSIILYDITIILFFFPVSWFHSNKHIKNDRCKSKINRVVKDRMKWVGHISLMTEMQKA